MVFDVRDWLVSLTGEPRESIVHVALRQASGSQTADYEGGGSFKAKVRVSGVNGNGGSARWQVVADLGDRVAIIELPGDTRFRWT